MHLLFSGHEHFGIFLLINISLFKMAMIVTLKAVTLSGITYSNPFIKKISTKNEEQGPKNIQISPDVMVTLQHSQKQTTLIMKT